MLAWVPDLKVPTIYLVGGTGFPFGCEIMAIRK